MSRVTELLESYEFWDDAARAKRRELDRQRDRRTSVKVSYSGEPRGKPQTLAEYMAERDEMEQDLKEIKEKRFEVFSQIMRLLLKLESKKQLDIIYRRHIHRDSWRRICKDLDVKRSTATDLHARAIRALEDIDSRT